MKQLVIFGSILTFTLAVSSEILHAQSTTVKLPTPTSASDFTVTDSSNNVLMRMQGDGGWYLQGTFNTGTIPIEGAGTRLLWYPKKAAFRAGNVSGTQWNDGDIGLYSAALGYNTSASGGSSVAMGYQTTASGTASIALGDYATASGYYAVAIGAEVTASGSFSTAMGRRVSTNGKSGAFIIGDALGPDLFSTANNQMMMRFAGGYVLYSNLTATVGVQLAGSGSSWSTISDSTKKTNFKQADGEYFLSSLSKLKLGSWNYTSQDPQQFRHYGPMAQEIFHYFGHDGIGTIGNDTTLATADMDGIIMICLQALEKRTRELKEAQETITRLNEEFQRQQAELAELKNAIRALTGASDQENQGVSISEKRNR
jgi:hypothetical protein